MHTPGPWKVAPAADGSHPVVAKINGRLARIAEVYPGDWPETPDNARLIAAAPDLLRHALWVCRLFGTDHPQGLADLRDHVKQLSAAVHEALGPLDLLHPNGRPNV